LPPCKSTLQAWPQQSPDHSGNHYPEADPPGIEELQQNVKTDAAQRDLDNGISRCKEEARTLMRG
jgi:hypothetical protein